MDAWPTGDGDTEKSKVIKSWCTSFKQGTDFDRWGQPVEAIEGYLRLSKQLKKEAKAEGQMLNDEQKKVLGKIAVCLELRGKALQTPGSVDGITLEDLKKIEPSLKNLLVDSAKEFPVDVNAVHAHVVKQRSFSIEDEGNQPEVDEDAPDTKAGGSLLPQPQPEEGRTFLTVRIEKIGLKDATQYIDSFITISVKDQSCVNQGPSQDTPFAVRKEDTYIYFDMDVHIQKPVETISKGLAIFFEFKHYKPKKKIVSTKCWSFIEKDEIKEGPCIIELYKKPTDFRRKNINLLTVKPLYLHLKLLLN